MKRYTLFTLIVSIALIISFACEKKDLMNPATNNIEAEKLTLPETPYDYSDKIFSSVSNNQIELGRVLFYDKKLSLNNTVSCGSCHKQANAFSDTKKFSVGLENKLTSRNSPVILNHGGNMFWDGRADNMSDLVLKPIQNHVEMKIYDLEILNEKLPKISYYPALFQKAYGSPEVTTSKIQQAMLSFLNCFTSYKSKSDLGQLNYEEKLGQDLFYDKARCGFCHSGNNFNGWTGAYENIGLDNVYEDQGRGGVTKIEMDYGRFKIPTLRNISLTAPYMHDGRFNTLEEVVEHYNSEIKPHNNLSIVLQENWGAPVIGDNTASITPVKLNLSLTEKKALVAFLKSLKDNDFIRDTRFSDPFTN